MSTCLENDLRSLLTICDGLQVPCYMATRVTPPRLRRIHITSNSPVIDAHSQDIMSISNTIKYIPPEHHCVAITPDLATVEGPTHGRSGCPGQHDVTSCCGFVDVESTGSQI